MANYLQRYTGWMILATLLLFIFSSLCPALIVSVAILAWLVVIIEWNKLHVGPRRQATFLFAAGIAALLFSYQQGVFLGWKRIITQNLQLLPMFIAVSFLGLTNPNTQADDLPKGKWAIAITSFGTNLLGAVINLSILLVFGDRLARKGTLTKAQSIILGRSFCAAAWWSPFFLAAGVALTYAPDMLYRRTVIPGMFLCFVALCYSIIEVGVVRKLEFSGYPVRAESMTVPFLLAVGVFVGHYFFPDLGMIMLICLVAPPAAIILMRNRPRLPLLHDFINNRITSTVSQFVLFLTAGLFSSGITSIIQVYPQIFNFEGSTFTNSLFAIISALLIVLGLIGLHPLVGISVISPLLLPLNPDHSQIAFLFLTCWAISTGSSPLSGVGLVLCSRYRVPVRSVLVNNFHYAVFMWLCANLVNIFYFNMI
ncbi:MAG: hypothetical protein ACNI3A_10780 [Desulfovibrio sp.]|uniref:hypothetical protein n=1 Tax=Desulfovibrio sp. 7SRBS1 TaxID=3378064 RepID=UPI003B3EE779